MRNVTLGNRMYLGIPETHIQPSPNQSQMTCGKSCVNKHELYLNEDTYSINEAATKKKKLKNEPMLASIAASTDLQRWLYFLAQADSSEVSANACLQAV